MTIGVGSDAVHSRLDSQITRGTPSNHQRRRVFSCDKPIGISKVNVGTELATIILEWLRAEWSAGKNLWVPTALAEAMRAGRKESP